MKNERFTKIICVTAVSAIGLVPGLSYVHPVQIQPCISEYRKTNDYSVEIPNNSYKAILPPVQIFNTSSTATSVSFTT
jgi:hypothetical protein